MQDERTRSKWRGERGRRKERERVAQSCCVTLRKTCRLVTNSSVIVKHEVVCPSGFSTGAVESPKSYFSTNTHTEPGGVPQRGTSAGPGVRLEGGEGTPAAGGLWAGQDERGTDRDGHCGRCGRKEGENNMQSWQKYRHSAFKKYIHLCYKLE